MNKSIVSAIALLCALVTGCNNDVAFPSPSDSDSIDSALANTCTSKLGNGISGGFGRLDGNVFAVVMPGTRNCFSDSSHVHLQVQSAGQVYDAAINLDSNTATTTAPLDGGAWQEGWHRASSLDYARDLNVHSTAFAPTEEKSLQAELAVGRSISVFMTPYARSGGHLIHRSRSGQRDGALVLDPDSNHPKYVLFSFSKQKF